MASNKMSQTKLEHLLKKKKGMSFSDYMEFVLFDKESGLYENHEILGKKGHFITSPLVSKQFSYCIAKHYIKEETLDIIVELGGGDASLACDLLCYLKDQNKLPKQYIFFEKSDYLIKKQKSIINEKSINTVVDISWISDFKDLPSEAFIISNELFDCLPTDIIKHVPGGYQQAYINKDFKMDWKEFDFESELSFIDLDLPKDLPYNYVFEYSHAQKDIINEISEFLHRAYFLIFDYGYTSSELYLKDRSLGTITCIRDHVADFNPLSDIGTKDVSAFVNFTYLKNILCRNHWEIVAFMSQANYLINFNILDDINVNDIDELNAVKKLIMPNHMGELFKVLIMSKNMKKTDKNYFMKNDIIKL